MIGQCPLRESKLNEKCIAKMECLKIDLVHGFSGQKNLYDVGGMNGVTTRTQNEETREILTRLLNIRSQSYLRWSFRRKSQKIRS